jgi:hypothetical protein
MNQDSQHAFDSDRALVHPKEDRLMRDGFSKELAEHIGSWNGQESIVIGINGNWGTGKSSVKNFIKHYLSERDKKPTIVDFNPWEWSGQNVLKAISLLTKTPHLGNTIKTLERFSADPARLHLAMEILDALLSKELKEAIWSFREDRIRIILQQAFTSGSAVTIKIAEKIQEILLRQGLFEYLEIPTSPINSQ